MGLPAWPWFTLAILAAGVGAALLFAERGRGLAPDRDRRRWAAQRDWSYVESDPMLPSRWRYGTIHQGGHGRARNLATGPVPGSDGRRSAHVFDLEQAGHITGVVAAVRTATTLPAVIELRLPSAPLPDDAGLDDVGPVGARLGFVTDLAAARPLVTHALAEAADRVGADIPLVWAEDSWVLATAPVDVDLERVESLLESLVGVAVTLESGGGGSRDLFDPMPPFRGSV